MNDQAAALRSLMERTPIRANTGDIHRASEVWAFASGSAGVGLRTVSENIRHAAAELGRSVQVWDYHRLIFAEHSAPPQPAEIVIAVLSDRMEARGIWRAADHAFLVAKLETNSVMSAYARLQRLGMPERAGHVQLLLNQVPRNSDVARLPRNFDQSTRKYLRFRTVLAGVVPHQGGDYRQQPPAGRLFAAGTPAARAIGRLTNDLLQRSASCAS